MKIQKDNVTFEVTGEPAWFWDKMSKGEWEPETFQILNKFLTPDSIVFDIGAWVGPISLYASRIAKEVFAFEPDPVASRTLETNIELNHIENIKVYPVAVSNKDGHIDIGARTEFGDSMTSELWSKNMIRVPSFLFSRIGQEHSPTFIKMDIEGGEYYALPPAKEYLLNYRPTLYLSLHTTWFEGDRKTDYLNAICNVLTIYPYLYDAYGQKITVEQIKKSDGFTSVVGTFENPK